MNGRKAQNGDAPPFTNAIEPLALQEPVRRRLDDGRPRGSDPARSHDVKCEAFQDDQITPPPCDSIGRRSLRSELDEPVPPVNQHAEFWTLAAGR